MAATGLRRTKSTSTARPTSTSLGMPGRSLNHSTALAGNRRRSSVLRPDKVSSRRPEACRSQVISLSKGLGSSEGDGSGRAGGGSCAPAARGVPQEKQKEVPDLTSAPQLPQKRCCGPGPSDILTTFPSHPCYPPPNVTGVAYLLTKPAASPIWSVFLGTMSQLICQTDVTGAYFAFLRTR